TLVSVSAGLYFHFLTALTAQSARMGLPPTTETSLTDPPSETTTSRRTMPPMEARFKSQGSSGVTLRISLRSTFSIFWACNVGWIQAVRNERQITTPRSVCEGRDAHRLRHTS